MTEKYGFRRGAFMRAKPRHFLRSITSRTAIQFFCALLVAAPANLLAQSASPPSKLPDASETAKAHSGRLCG